MTNQELAEKAINIKGKKYVLVSDRILAFNDEHKDGSITTEILPNDENGLYIVKATVSVGGRTFTGHSQAKVGDGMVNATAALENAETSAVGRALAMMGIGVIDSVASADEMKKAGAIQKDPTSSNPAPQAVENEYPCPKCGSPLRVKTAKNGKKVTECSKRTWSPELGPQGCEFMVWGPYEPEEDYPLPEEEL